MDGAQLLAEVRRRYPATARIILSGHADRASIISAPSGRPSSTWPSPARSTSWSPRSSGCSAVRDLDRRRPAAPTCSAAWSRCPSRRQSTSRCWPSPSDPDCSLDDVVAVIERRRGDQRRGAAPGQLLVLRAARAGRVRRPGGEPARAGDDPGPRRRRGRLRLRRGTGPRPRPARAVPAGAARRPARQGVRGERRLVPATPSTTRSSPASCTRWASPSSRRRTPTRGTRSASGARSTRGSRTRSQVAAFGCSATEASAYLLGLWGFGDSVVAAVADQPARPGDLTATPAAHVLTVARARAHDAALPRAADPVGFLTAERLPGLGRRGRGPARAARRGPGTGPRPGRRAGRRDRGSRARVAPGAPATAPVDPEGRRAPSRSAVRVDPVAKG